MQNNNVNNTTGAWCIQNNILCEHNLQTAPHVGRDVCSGIGGVCIRGSKFSNPNQICIQCGKELAYRRNGHSYRLCPRCALDAIEEVIANMYASE